DRARDVTALSVDQRRPGRARRGVAPQAAVLEHAVLPGAGGVVLPRLERPVVLPERVVAGAGSQSGPTHRPADAEAERRRAAGLRPDDYVCSVRLADVARAALVLDHLRRLDHGRTGPLGSRPSHRGAGLAPPAG